MIMSPYLFDDEPVKSIGMFSFLVPTPIHWMISWIGIVISWS